MKQASFNKIRTVNLCKSGARHCKAFDLFCIHKIFDFARALSTFTQLKVKQALKMKNKKNDQNCKLKLQIMRFDFLRLLENTAWKKRKQTCQMTNQICKKLKKTDLNQLDETAWQGWFWVQNTGKFLSYLKLFISTFYFNILFSSSWLW